LWRSKIPVEPAGMELDILTKAQIAYWNAINLRPPIPRSKAAFAEYLKTHKIVPLSFAIIATEAEISHEDLQKIPSTTRARWPEMSPTGMTFDAAVEAIKDIAETCGRLDAEARELEAALQLPKPPRRRGASKAQRTFFGRIMSSFFQETYGTPCDQAVNILEDVMFDLRGEIEDTTARSRRRGGGT
jgi:hypothetical protein